jgi:ABC-type glycerol-3-phosphate transport system substrate-binding protein
VKKLTLILLILSVLVSAWAEGKREAAVTEVTVLHSGGTPIGGGKTHLDYAVEKLAKDYPGVAVKLLKIDLSTGAAITMDAMLAAGTAPDIYIDTMVRTSKYMVPEFAAPLDGIIRDLDKYPAATLAPYRRDGKLLALPVPGGAQAMCINLEIMRDIGFEVRDDWTTDDFLVMAEKVKQKYGGKKWATGFFAANQSGDYLLHNWFPAFGVEYYQNANYDRTTIRETGGVKVYEWYKKLNDNGYIPPSAGTLNDDDYAAAWAEGKYAATAFFESWCKPYFDTAISQGLIKQPWPYKFVPFPRGPGVKSVPVYVSNGAFIVRKSSPAREAVAGRFAEYANSAEVQAGIARETQVPPNRTDVKAEMSGRNTEIAAIAARNGVYDAGLTDPRFTARRSTQFPILQKLLAGKLSPAEAIAEYESALNEVR